MCLGQAVGSVLLQAGGSLGFGQPAIGDFFIQRLIAWYMTFTNIYTEYYRGERLFCDSNRIWIRFCFHTGPGMMPVMAATCLDQYNKRPDKTINRDYA